MVITKGPCTIIFGHLEKVTVTSLYEIVIDRVDRIYKHVCYSVYICDGPIRRSGHEFVNWELRSDLPSGGVILWL